jgi:integrase
MIGRDDPRRRCLKLADWPPAERAAWEAALASPSGRFSGRSYAATLSPRTLKKAAGGYGRWKAFLRLRGWDDPDLRPGDQPTEERLNAYFEELLELGNADHTVTGRFAELHTALRILDPGRPRPDILRPNGISLRCFLEMKRKDRQVRSPNELMVWGTELIRGALQRSPRRRQVQMRDGLLICILATRGPRLRSVLSLRLGHSIRREPETGVWWLNVPSEDVKNDKPIRYPLPESLAPFIDRYLAVERAELLGNASSDAFWINWGGKPLGKRGLDKRIRWLSEKRYGRDDVFGPHYFRYCIAESGALLAPGQPGLAAAMLQITPEVVDKHYDRSDMVRAAQAHAEVVKALRKKR